MLFLTVFRIICLYLHKGRVNWCDYVNLLNRVLVSSSVLGGAYLPYVPVQIHEPLNDFYSGCVIPVTMDTILNLALEKITNLEGS